MHIVNRTAVFFISSISNIRYGSKPDESRMHDPMISLRRESVCPGTTRLYKMIEKMIPKAMDTEHPQVRSLSVRMSESIILYFPLISCDSSHCPIRLMFVRSNVRSNDASIFCN